MCNYNKQSTHTYELIVYAVCVLSFPSFIIAQLLVHCFTGTPDELAWYVEFGCYIGFTGHLRNKKRAQEMRDHLFLHKGTEAALPLERVMVETDAPYMGFKGCRTAEDLDRKKSSPNVPSALPLVVNGLAELMGVEAHTLATHCTHNAEMFFSMK